MDDKYLDKIPDIPIFTPICMYMHESNEHLGYLGTPMPVRKEKGIFFECGINTSIDTYQGWKYTGRFYGINAMFRPIPSYMSLMCAKKVQAFPYNSVDVQQAYDPFHIEPDCVNFIVWMEPNPYTTPLFIYKTEQGVYSTFENLNHKLTRLQLSPIYVLTETPTPLSIRPDKRWFKIVDGIPQFKFKNYQGRCIPDPDGVDLLECSIYHDINLIKPLSLLQYMKAIEGKESPIVDTVVTKTNTFVILIVLVIFLLTLFLVVRMLLK